MYTKSIFISKRLYITTRGPNCKLKGLLGHPNRKGITSRADLRVLRWFGRVERMDEYHMARRVMMAEISGGRVRGRPRLGWMDGVKVALGNTGMKVEAAVNARKAGKSGEP